METAHITRDLLQEAIEFGIALSCDLMDSDRDALRRVGEVTSKVARAQYNGETCDCPAAQAGLAITDAVDNFASAFDHYTFSGPYFTEHGRPADELIIED